MRRLAYHEAGHAVIARALGIEVHLATIRSDEFSHGRIESEACWPDRRLIETIEDREEQIEEWQRAMETAEDCAKLALAGPIAEMKYEPTLDGEFFAIPPDSNDLLNVADYLKIASGFTPLSELLIPGKPLKQNDREAAILWDSLQKDTAALVELHWASIERVAEALLVHGELGPEAIDALIC